MSRPQGHGTVTPVVNPTTGEVRYRARLPRIYEQKSIGIFDSYEEAEQHLEAWTNTRKRPSVGESFGTFAENVLKLREEDGIRSVKSEVNRFKCHLKDSDFAKLPVAEIRPVDVSDLGRSLARKNAQDKRGTRKVARSTVQRVLALVSTIFTEAVDRQVRPDNPCIGVKIKKKQEQTSASESEEEAWDYMRLEEQNAFLECDKIEEWGKVAVAFAMGTGLRVSEQWCLELSDVHVDEPEPYIFVRWGSPGKAPKNGKRRKVFLFGVGLWAVKRQLELLPEYLTSKQAKDERTGKPKVHKNKFGLLFPSPTGLRRTMSDAPNKSVRVRTKDGKTKVTKVDLLPEWLKAAGVKRHLRWHDLRHTFCSSLVSGFWGRAWTLAEVKEAAGHSSVTVTEKYAHLADTAQKKAARETSYPSQNCTTAGGITQELVAAIVSDITGLPLVGRGGLEPPTYGLKGVKTTHEILRQFGKNPQIGAVVARLVEHAVTERLNGTHIDKEDPS